ncbi:MAG TPA: ABC transporter ATP-binding protein [Verrucomicrobiae bacterium]|nr:ABC transporter ATP-binding protein [Verrucomicrobiae bacterium]
MDTYSIETKNVSRSFGENTVVRDLNLRVRRGSIYGLLGRNGAGKTTLIKMLAGLIWPDAGELRVNGVEPVHFTVADRRKIGYVSEKQILMPGIRVGALIEFTSNFYPDWDFAACDRFLRRFKIDPSKRVRALSQGTARQVAFLLALAQKPELLILDEPAANLDVVARREFMDEILQLLREERKTVLISSHILSDIERVADEVGIMTHGTLKISEPLDVLKDTVKQVRFHGFERGTNGFQIPEAFYMRKTADEVLATVRLENEDALPNLAAAHHCQYEVMHLNLEDLFVELVREKE